MAVPSDQAEPASTRVPAPLWISASLEAKEGRDPLGLQTTTQDRLMPVLLPGILELTTRARYFSFHAFLLSEYRLKHLPSDETSLAAFIRQREWEFGLAVQRCPRHCGLSPVGARRLGNLAQGAGPFPRGESVESRLGGYGLYYRTPMAEVGVVARAGTMLGDTPIPIDVLHQTERAERLANGFRSAVEGTEYFQRKLMLTSESLPASVIDEYAEVACLCRLQEFPDEREAVQDALFGTDPPEEQPPPTEEADTTAGVLVSEGTALADAAVEQRRRSVGHFLSLVNQRPAAVDSESAYRDALWAPPELRNQAHGLIADQWAALVAKDVWQDAICSVWSDFCRAGLARSRAIGRGLTWDETREVALALVSGPPALDPEQLTTALDASLAAGTLPGPDGTPVSIAGANLETLRRLTTNLDSASSGLVVLLELARRTAERTGEGWVQASRVASGWQPSVAAVIAALETHLNDEPKIAETLWWLVSRFVLPVHERIAYSKLPEFTFRFRWEDGLLRFYDQGMGRFPLAGIRHNALTSLTQDLGLWDAGQDGTARLTERGRSFVDEVFA